MNANQDINDEISDQNILGAAMKDGIQYFYAIFFDPINEIEYGFL